MPDLRLIRRAALAAALALACAPQVVYAQVTPTVRQSSPQTIEIPSYRPAGATQIIDDAGHVVGTSSNPLKVDATVNVGSVTASTAADAGSALPSLAPGSRNQQQSLGGGLYVQPVFGSASGGGTQVDATHGMPVNVLTGSLGVTGTFWQVTQPISAAALPLPVGAMSQTGGTVGLVAGSALVGKFGIDQTTPGATNAVNLRNVSGTEIGTSAMPVQISLANTAPNATAVKVDNSAVTQPVSGAVTAVSAQAAATARGATITAGGSSQTLMAANGSRKALIVQNPCTAAEQGIAAAENLAVNLTAAASLSTSANLAVLEPCGSVSLGIGSGVVSTEPVTVNAVTTGHVVYAKEF